MKKLIPLTILLLLPLISVKAAELNVTMEPPQGWSNEHSDPQADDGYPTIVYYPSGGRDACLTVMEVSEVGPATDKNEFLRKNHLWWFKQLRKTIPAPDNLSEFHSDHGEFLVSVFEDPNLKGKPIIREDYKYTVHISGIVDERYVVKCFLLTQERDGRDFQEVITSIKSMKSK